MLNKDEDKVDLLQKKPQRQKKPRLAPLLLLMGGIVILSTLLVAAWQVYTLNNTSSRTPSNASSQAPKTSTQQVNTSNDAPFWDHYPDVYWQTLRTQAAQGFHMNVQQMKSALLSSGATATQDRGKLGKL